MKFWLSVFLLLLAATFVFAQQPVEVDTGNQQSSCTKNVSFAVAEGGQPVPDIPKFALKWLSGKARKEGFAKICFSQIPSASLTNYVVIFSTTEAAFNGLTPQAHTYTTATTAHDGNTPVSSFGGTWTYAYAGTAPPATTDSLSLKRDDKPKSLAARAYSQSGKMLAQYNLSAVGSRDKLIEDVMKDVLNDSPQAISRKQVAAPLSVYYVNCDVDSPPVSNSATASASTPAAVTPVKATAPVAAPPPPPELLIWSSPGGADVFVDGLFVGKTPFQLTVPLGDHLITMRKKDFGIWQRKVTAIPGKQRVSAYLEQKILELN